MKEAYNLLTNYLNSNIESGYIGIIESNEDPLKIGRLKIRIPELYGNIRIEDLPWAIPESSFAGNGYGFFMIPKAGAKVHVKLFRGHSWFPIWTGFHWFNNEAPEEAKITPPESYVIKTPKGNLIELNDKETKIRIKDIQGNEIILSDIGINIVSKGNCNITIEGSCNINSTGNCNIAAPTINLN